VDKDLKIRLKERLRLRKILLVICTRKHCKEISKNNKKIKEVLQIFNKDPKIKELTQKQLEKMKK